MSCHLVQQLSRSQTRSSGNDGMIYNKWTIIMELTSYSNNWTLWGLKFNYNQTEIHFPQTPYFSHYNLHAVMGRHAPVLMELLCFYLSFHVNVNNPFLCGYYFPLDHLSLWRWSSSEYMFAYSALIITRCTILLFNCLASPPHFFFFFTFPYFHILNWIGCTWDYIKITLFWGGTIHIVNIISLICFW